MTKKQLLTPISDVFETWANDSEIYFQVHDCGELRFNEKPDSNDYLVVRKEGRYYDLVESPYLKIDERQTDVTKVVELVVQYVMDFVE